METEHIVKQAAITDDTVLQRIYLVRGKRIMLDRDLAVLYDYETKRMNEQVKRNQSRFPANFMFQLTSDEVGRLQSQFATANVSVKSRTLPYAFTEHGVLMLASVLKSETAVQVSVHVVEAFVKLREMVLTHKDILFKIEQLEKKQVVQDASIKQLLQYIKLFVHHKQHPQSPIGFKTK